MNNFSIIFLVLLIILSSTVILKTKNLFTAGFSLLITFICVALIIMFHDVFIGIAHIMIYSGGILILVLFGIMLSGLEESKLKPLVFSFKTVPLFVILFWGLSMLVLSNRVQKTKISQSEAPDIALQFVGKHVVSFELIAFALLFILIGSIIILKRAYDS